MDIRDTTKELLMYTVVFIAFTLFFFVFKNIFFIQMEGEEATGSLGPSVPLEQTYVSRQYLFSFDVPRGFALKEYIPEAVAVGQSLQSGGFNPNAEVVFVVREEDQKYKNFDAFLLEQSKQMCAADGPGEAIYCTNMLRKVPYTTRSGINGSSYYLTRVYERVETREKKTEEFGPLFAFDMSSTTNNKTFAALIVRPATTLFTDEIDRGLIREIANSLEIHTLLSETE